MDARHLHFSIDELRRRYGGLVPLGEDPRHHTGPFRAFRAALLEAAARAAVAPCRLSMAWSGSFNGYQLVVTVEPPGALPALDLGTVCDVEQDVVARPRPDRYPLARVEPGRASVAHEPDGATHEAPFGAATGHFGAPGMRRMER